MKQWREKKVGGKLVITDEGTERGSDRRWGESRRREERGGRGEEINVAKVRDGLRGGE